METIFQTERLFIRQFSMDDIEDFYRLHGDEEIMRYIRAPKTREQATEFLIENIEMYKTQPGLGRWAMLAADQSTTIGSFAVIPVKDSTDIQLGYVLFKENWGKGYASEAVKGGLDYARTRLNLESIAGITEIANTASQQVLLKNGFVFEKNFFEEEKELYFYRRRFE